VEFETRPASAAQGVMDTVVMWSLWIVEDEVTAWSQFRMCMRKTRGASPAVD
jgi:hypothetical protein